MTEFLFFTQPLALFLTMLLPIIWLLLRLFPLKARPVIFPALVLFGKDKKDRPKPRNIPPWLKLLRLAVLLFLILGLARPVYDPGREALSFSPTLIVIDNSWSSTVGWAQRISAIQSRLDAFADISQVPITIITTAANQNTGQLDFEKNISAQDASRFLSTLAPQPWPSDFDAANDLIKPYLYTQDKRWQVYWFGDGQNGEAFKKFFDTVASYATDTVLYHDNDLNQKLAITNVNSAPEGLLIDVKRSIAEQEYNYTLSVINQAGDTVLQQDATLPSQSYNAQELVKIPDDVLSNISAVKISPAQSAATIWTFEGGLGRGHAGIITERDIMQKQDYLNDVFYIHRALDTTASVTTGKTSDLLSDEQISLVVLPDSTKLNESEYAALSTWVNGGGTLLRFAGNNLLEEEAPKLLPVKIINGQRSFGGALTWEEPARINEFDARSPFAFTAIPKTVNVQKQILARPDISLNNKVWARLEDKTPLITADKTGQGQVIFVHTTADTSWSDLAISDFFPTMLETILNHSSQRQLQASKDSVMSLARMFDAYGHEVQSSRIATPKKYSDILKDAPSYDTPAGIYQMDASDDLSAPRIAVNLGQVAAADITPTSPYYFFDDMATYAEKPYKNLSVYFFVLAGLLMLVEMIASFVLIHGAKRLKPAFLMIALFILCVAPHSSMAQEVEQSIISSPQNNINFAYIKTGDSTRDQISAKGLDVLGNVIKQRTTVEYGSTQGVNPTEDDLSLYPFLYWPMVSSQEDLSAEALSALQSYIDHGGLIFFDTRDGQYQSTGSTLGQDTMQRLAGNLSFGALEKLNYDHVLSRSYYLLKSYEGLYKGPPVWLETATSSDYDGAPSIVIGANDWAGAWANVDPDMGVIELQTNLRSREMALRFGVNLVMTALTGSYKTDQVHVKYILDRMQPDE